MSLNTVSESSGSSRLVSHSVVAGDITRAPELHSGIAVEADEFDEDVEDDDADCGRSRLSWRCLIVPAFSFANGIWSIESIDEFDWKLKFRLKFVSSIKSSADVAHHTNFNLRMLDVHFRLRLMHLSRVKLPKVAAAVHHLVLIDHLMVERRLELRRRQTRPAVVHRRPVDVAFLDFLAYFVLDGCRAALPSNGADRFRWWRRAVVHRHLLPRLRRVVRVEQRLLRRKIDFGGHGALCLALLTRKRSAARRRIVLRLHDLVRWRDVPVVVTATPVLEIRKRIYNKTLRMELRLFLPSHAPSPGADNEFGWLASWSFAPGGARGAFGGRKSWLLMAKVWIAPRGTEKGSESFRQLVKESFERGNSTWE